MTVQRWGRINWRFKSAEWSDTLDFRGERDVESAGQDWTRVECMANNGTIRILVNGTLVNEASDVWPRQGRILLQCEGSEIFFRRVDLQPLPASE